LTLDSILFKEKSNREYDMNRTNVLFLKGIKEMIVFSRTQDPCNETIQTFAVQVDFKSDFKSMRMEVMTESLWTCLQQAIGISERIFQEIIPVQHYLVNQTDETNEINYFDSLDVKKRLVLVMDIYYKRKIAMNMFEYMTFVQRLPIEDQIILIKEMLYSDIIDLHTQDRETYAYSRTAVGNHLMFHWHLNSFEGTDEYKKVFKTLFDCTLDVLRFDPFVITLLIIIYFFQVRPGLTCSEEIYEEQIKYVQLLDIYITAKIKSGLWTSTSYKQAWLNIKLIIEQLNGMKPLFTQIYKKNPL